jgi:hypothetical protein
LYLVLCIIAYAPFDFQLYHRAKMANGANLAF